MNKKYIILAGLLILFTIMQTSMFPHMKILGVAPDLVLIFVATYAYFKGSMEGMLVGLAGGLLMDVLVGDTLGVYGLIFMIICFIVGFFPRKNIRDNFFIIFAVVIAAFIPAAIMVYLAQRLAIVFTENARVVEINIDWFFAQRIVPAILYNSLVFIPIYRIVKWFDGKFGGGRYV